MKTEFWMTGKTNHVYLQSGIELYVKRIKHFIPFEIVEIKTTKAKSAEESIRVEQEAVLKLLNPADRLILLDEKGKNMDSFQFSDYLQKQFLSSPNRLIFLIGGAYGFGDELYKRGDNRLALSKMTFPHDLVRVIFLEQLYRGLSILSNHPYQH